MKYLVITKKTLIILCSAVIAIIFISAGGFSLLTSTVAAAKKSLPIYSVETDKKQVALTFDAAWGADDTQQLIDIFEKYNVKATFFVVGDWAQRFPQSVKALSNAGHSIQNHSLNHKKYSTLSSAEIKDDIAACNELIASLTGTNPTLIRTPYGDYNNESIDTINSLGLYPIQWDTDSLDYKKLSVDNIVKRVVNAVQNGSIVLFHNDVENTPKALPVIIENLQKQGYSFVTVDELIYKDNYTIDASGRQRKN